MRSTDKFEIISEIAKRRGFFWPSFEIYGGVSGFMTLGPLGATLKRRIENRLRDSFIREVGLFEIETPVIMPGKVFEASGHVNAFKEPMVECRDCKRKFRADHLLLEFAGMKETDTEKLNLQELMDEINKRKIRCPECGGNFDEPKQFLTMFTTTIGPYSEAVGYGRPEAAQGIFVEYKRIYEYTREKLPFGVAIIGHALRNEISPRQGPIRLREFTIMDLEFFFDPEDPQCTMLEEVEDETLRLLPTERLLKGIEEPIEITVKEALSKKLIATEWQAFFMALSRRFLARLGVPKDKQRFIEKFDWERAHYSMQGYDQQVYLERWGWVEVSGHNYRTDYDLKHHMEFSGVDLTAFQKYGKTVVKEETKIKPIMSKIGPVFKEKASEVVKLLSSVDPEEMEKAFEKQNFYTVDSFKILPEHVKITHKKVKKKGRRFIPHVVEPSFGSDRLFYVTLEYAYRTKEDRTLLALPRDLAPVEVAVFPLMSKDGLSEKAKQVYQMLVDAGFTVEYDESGSIGRRYARADEIGTPLGVTVDYRTLKDNTVTIRDRDTWRQVRNKIDELSALFHSYFCCKIEFEKLGQLVKS